VTESRARQNGKEALVQKHWLEPPDFVNVIRLTPLVSIDLILRSADGTALLGRRAFEPARGFWFVPGGRIGKTETLDEAFARILEDETGLVLGREMSRFLGVYEHFYDANRFGEPGFGTHYVVLAHELVLPQRPAIVANDQHETMRWMTPAAILSAPDVHENTKVYFRG
jgi:colanic acid biosynthesis protein WcaH